MSRIIRIALFFLPVYCFAIAGCSLWDWAQTEEGIQAISESADTLVEGLGSGPIGWVTAGVLAIGNVIQAFFKGKKS